jgi:hypothetical protein
MSSHFIRARARVLESVGPRRPLQVRLMLVLAPAACCLAGVGANEALTLFCRSLRVAGTAAAEPEAPQPEEKATPRKATKSTKVRMMAGRQSDSHDG